MHVRDEPVQVGHLVVHRATSGEAVYAEEAALKAELLGLKYENSNTKFIYMKMSFLTRSGMSGGKSISQGSAVDLGGWMGWSEKSGKKRQGVIFCTNIQRRAGKVFFECIVHGGKRREFPWVFVSCTVSEILLL